MTSEGHREQVAPSNTTKPGPSDSASHSLAYMNFRRSVSYGKVYLIIGIVISLFLSATVASAIHAVTRSAGSVIVSQIPALVVPLAAVVGSLGGLMIFASDKAKGVFEYLIAYGVNVSSIFWSIVLATVGLVSIVLVISISSTFAILYALGAPISYSFVELLIYYSIPISYTGAMFMSMAGMIWTSLATRRAGLNSPVGAAPMLGIAPILVVLILSSRVGSGNFILLVGSVSLALIVIVGVMVGVSNRKMVRERFLSNA